MKLLQIYGWKPKPYKNATFLPNEAPQALKDIATTFEANNPNAVGKMIWLSCEGENPADVENIGEIKYHPYPGIPHYYFPYENQEGYLSPVIFAHLKNPRSK